MESKKHKLRRNSSDDDKRVSEMPKQTRQRLASESRTKPEIKSTTTRPVKQPPMEEFFEHNVSDRVSRKHLSQSFSAHSKAESVVSNRSEEGRVIRFLIERSEFISVKKQSV
jgi:hypothetical protein